MKIAFETDGIFLLDLVRALQEIGHEKGREYRVIGKVGNSHHIEFEDECTGGLAPASFAVFISFMMQGAWYSKVRPVP